MGSDLSNPALVAEAEFAVGGTAWVDLGQQAAGDALPGAEIVVPVFAVQIPEHGAGGVGAVGGVDFAVGETCDEPAVDGAGGEVTGGEVAGAGCVLQRPGDFGAGEVGVWVQSGAQANFAAVRRAQLLRNGGCAAALPDDSGGDGGDGFALPDQRGFALVGDGDSGDAVWVNRRQGIAGGGDLGGPDLIAGLLNPARLRKR